MTMLPMAKQDDWYKVLLGGEQKRRGMFGAGRMTAPTYLSDGGEVQSKAGNLALPMNAPSNPVATTSAVVPQAEPSRELTAGDVMGVSGGKKGMMGKRARAPWESSTWEKIGNVLSAISTGLMAAQASADGNWSAAASMNNSMAEQIGARKRRAQLGNAMRSMGYDDNQIMVALSDPESIGRNFNERMGTRVVSPGSSVVTGVPSGQAVAHNQPNQFEAYATSLVSADGRRR